jgi:hypothetical protein
MIETAADTLEAAEIDARPKVVLVDAGLLLGGDLRRAAAAGIDVLVAQAGAQGDGRSRWGSGVRTFAEASALSQRGLALRSRYVTDRAGRAFDPLPFYEAFDGDDER